MSQATLTQRPYHNSNLFSSHYLDERIKNRSEWDCDARAEEVMQELQNLYQLEGNLVEGYKEDDLINTWIDEVLNTLGYGTQVETTLPEGNGYVDVLLFENDEQRRNAASLYLDTKNTKDLFNNGVGVVEAKQWDADFNVRFSEQRPYRDASHQIKHYLENVENIEWGVLTNGRKWRLYGTKDYETKTYYEVDLPELLEQGDVEQFKYFYTFFRPEALRETAGSTFLETVWSESETASQELGEDLQDNVFTALRILGHGFIESNDLDIDPDDTEVLDQLKEQSLVLLYRLMFVLYAESRNLIHPEEPGAIEEYEENFSLDQLRLSIHDAIGEVDQGFESEYSEHSSTMWRQLEDLFHLIDKGEESLGIPPYNGGLFDREKHEFLAANSVTNQHLAEVIYRLSTTQNEDGRYVLADYGDLDTRHLGSVYEGLLEHQFRIAPEDYAAVEEDGGQVWKPATEVTVAESVETVSEGSLYVVNDEGERKATGAYYTPDYVVTYIVEETVDPLIDEIQEDLIDQGFEPGTQEYLGPFLRRITDLKILDPAMGSGHFLTRATGYLTEQVMHEVREVEEEMGVAFDEQHIRREIAKECIYGVDLNGMAVELAKLSMWLDTLAADRPLAFLDHHLKSGNSLVGSDVTQVLSNGSPAGDDDGQITLTQAWARVRQDTLEHVMERMQELLEIDNETLEDVKSMEEIYDQIREDPLYQRLFELTNVHTSERFGLDVPESAYEQMASAIEDESEWSEIQEEDWFRSAQSHSNGELFFHWELEYPEVFFNEDGKKLEDAGFDAVIGNPPYIRIQELRNSNSRQADYLIGKYRSAEKSFDIYVNFTEKGYDILRQDGLLGYIEPHKFFQSDFGEGLREYLSEKKALKKVVSFGRHQVFEGASVYTCVLILQRKQNNIFKFSEVDPEIISQGDDIVFHDSEATYSEEPWIFQSPETLKILNLIESSGPSLAEITSKIYQGVVTSADDIYLVEVREELGDKVVVANGNGEEFEIESELARPFLKGQDVKRYSPLSPPQHIILPYKLSNGADPEFIEEATLERKYPKTHSYFKAHEKELRKRDGGSMDGSRWYDLTRNQNMGEFSKSKILTPEISYGSNFAYDSEGIFHKSKVYGIILESEWESKERSLLSILNSSLLWYYLKNTGYVLRGGYFTFKTEYLKPFCVPDQKKLESEIHESTFEKKLPELANIEEEAKRNLQDLNQSLTDHLGSYSDGQTINEVGLTQPPAGSLDSPLQKTSDDLDSLRVGEVSVERISSSSIEIQLTARYKPQEDDEYETDQWGYTETGLLPALQISDLSEMEAALIKEFVPVAVDKAGGFADFRETATKTNSLVDRLRKLTLPQLSEIDQRFESYLNTKQRAEELEDKIEETDQLIDETVYELYGLTEEEIEIVEEAVNQ